MSTNSISCKTCLRKDYVAANGLRQVILRVTINRKYKQYQTHVRCKEEDWDPFNRRIKRKHPNAKDLNKLIENAEKRYVEISTYFYLQQMPPSHEVFDAMYYQKIAHTLVHTVFYKILEYKSKTKQIERATQVAHGCFIRRLHKYAPQLQFYEIDALFLAKWDESLIAEGLGQNQ